MQAPVVDLNFSNSTIEQDDGLETTVIIALFTDRRANPDDSVPGDPADRRGWWGDAYPAKVADRIGSRLWLLYREKQMQVVVQRAREYTAEALRFLLEDGIATRVDSDAYIAGPGILAIEAIIYRPTGNIINFRYAYTWQAQQMRAA